MFNTGIDFNIYQSKAARTIDPEQTKRENLINFSFGLAGETGEVIDEIKKHLFHGHAIDEKELIKELGDVLWYINGLCTALGINMEDVATTNIRKLEARYPDGFDKSKSINREENCVHEWQYIADVSKGMTNPSYYKQCRKCGKEEQ